MKNRPKGSAPCVYAHFSCSGTFFHNCCKKKKERKKTIKIHYNMYVSIIIIMRQQASQTAIAICNVALKYNEPISTLVWLKPYLRTTMVNFADCQVFLQLGRVQNYQRWDKVEAGLFLRMPCDVNFKVIIILTCTQSHLGVCYGTLARAYWVRNSI